MVFDDFFNWLDSDAGEASSQAIDDIQLAFDGASVDLNERKIIWGDGESLSIDQSAVKIKRLSDVDINILKHHIVIMVGNGFCS